jgi:hypothetical protein
LNGEPLFDRPPPMPASDFYAVAPGAIWYRLPDEAEGEFRERVRLAAVALGLDRVTTWRRKQSAWRTE